MLCSYYDSMRRMEQIRKARAHVSRPGFHESCERICQASVERLDAAMHSLGGAASIRDVLRAPMSTRT